MERKHGIAWREVVVENDVGERTNFARRAFGDIIKKPLLLLALPFTVGFGHVGHTGLAGQVFAGNLAGRSLRHR